MTLDDLRKAFDEAQIARIGSEWTEKDQQEDFDFWAKDWSKAYLDPKIADSWASQNSLCRRSAVTATQYIIAKEQGIEAAVLWKLSLSCL